MSVDPTAIVIAFVENCSDVLDEAVDNLPIGRRAKIQMRTVMALTLLARVCVESGISDEAACAMVRTLLPDKMAAIRDGHAAGVVKHYADGLECAVCHETWPCSEDEP